MSLRVVIRIAIVLVLVLAAWYGGGVFLRANAIVVPVTRDTAVNAAPGTITVLAARTADVRSEVSGRIVKDQLRVGEPVAAGTALIELDTEEVLIQIRRDENDVTAARRRLEIGPTLNTELLNAKDELVLREELFKSGSIGALELERHRRTVAQIEQRIDLERVNLAQQVATLESALALNRHKLTLMSIVSPIDGVISEVNAGVGDLVNPGSPIARITSNERIVEARVSEENFAGVRVGQRATVRFLQHGGMLYKATVAKILPEADPQTQRYRVHLDVVIEPEKLVPGITGEASITLEERPNALVVPRTALLGTSVFVVTGGRVERRRVEMGYRALNAVEILSGVSEGDLVIVENLDRIRDGDRVSVRRRASEEAF